MISREQAFTDEELKVLKDTYLHINESSGICLLKPEMDALLARLEAAEAICLIVGQSFMPIDKAEAIELALIAWRKSCGRED